MKASGACREGRRVLGLHEPVLDGLGHRVGTRAAGQVRKRTFQSAVPPLGATTWASGSMSRHPPQGKVITPNTVTWIGDGPSFFATSRKGSSCPARTMG